MLSILLEIIQIDGLTSLINLIGPTNFLIVSGLFLLYQMYSPEALPDTKFQEVARRFENQIDDVESSLNNQLDQIETKQLASIQIIRAIASVENPSEEIDDEVVDDYLIQNGIEKDRFILGRDEKSKLDDDTSSQVTPENIEEVINSLQDQDED